MYTNGEIENRYIAFIPKNSAKTFENEISIIWEDSVVDEALDKYRNAFGAEESLYKRFFEFSCARAHARKNPYNSLAHTISIN